MIFFLTLNVRKAYEMTLIIFTLSTLDRDSKKKIDF
jgi:hypothetical protein